MEREIHPFWKSGMALTWVAVAAHVKILSLSQQIFLKGRAG